MEGFINPMFGPTVSARMSGPTAAQPISTLVQNSVLKMVLLFLGEMSDFNTVAGIREWMWIILLSQKVMRCSETSKVKASTMMGNGKEILEANFPIIDVDTLP